jgi:hypothetical protein
MKSPIIAKQKELNVCGWQAVSMLHLSLDLLGKR